MNYEIFAKVCVGVWKWYIFRNTSRNIYNWFESILALYFRVTFVLKLITLFYYSLQKEEAKISLHIYVCLETCIKPMVWVARFGRARIFSKSGKLYVYNATLVFFIYSICTICRNYAKWEHWSIISSKAWELFQRVMIFCLLIFFNLP